MVIWPTEISDVKLARPRRFTDKRGVFTETYNRRVFLEAGIDVVFVQDNQSVSWCEGTVRALHFQIPPAAQAKLVSVARGAILDVAVDIRRGSPTYGRHIANRLTSEGGEQVFIPPGFAHGFCTLEPNTEVHYKVSAFYAPDHERGLRWDDPALGIDWPVSAEVAIVNERDRSLPMFADLENWFTFGAS